MQTVLGRYFKKALSIYLWTAPIYGAGEDPGEDPAGKAGAAKSPQLRAKGGIRLAILAR